MDRFLRYLWPAQHKECPWELNLDRGRFLKTVFQLWHWLVLEADCSFLAKEEALILFDRSSYSSFLYQSICLIYLSIYLSSVYHLSVCHLYLSISIIYLLSSISVCHLSVYPSIRNSSAFFTWLQNRLYSRDSWIPELLKEIKGVWAGSRNREKQRFLVF